jgi:hypothetical protein
LKVELYSVCPKIPLQIILITPKTSLGLKIIGLSGKTTPQLMLIAKDIIPNLRKLGPYGLSGIGTIFGSLQNVGPFYQLLS